MASVNKVILVGNCGRDPEVRYLPSGQAVANVSVATSSKRKDRNSGEMIEDTQWHRITFYDRLAEIAGQYLKKGREVYIEGRIQSRKYTGKDGIERTAYDIIANEMKMVGPREGGAWLLPRGFTDQSKPNPLAPPPAANTNTPPQQQPSNFNRQPPPNAQPLGSKGETAGLLKHDEAGKMLKVQHYPESR